eukprot:jgi/Botrbrau1/13537/Bobra.0347s0021.1
MWESHHSVGCSNLFEHLASKRFCSLFIGHFLPCPKQVRRIKAVLPGLASVSLVCSGMPEVSIRAAIVYAYATVLLGLLVLASPFTACSAAVRLFQGWADSHFRLGGLPYVRG